MADNTTLAAERKKVLRVPPGEPRLTAGASSALTLPRRGPASGSRYLCFTHLRDGEGFPVSRGFLRHCMPGSRQTAFYANSGIMSGVIFSVTVDGLMAEVILYTFAHCFMWGSCFAFLVSVWNSFPGSFSVRPMARLAMQRAADSWMLRP